MLMGCCFFGFGAHPRGEEASDRAESKKRVQRAWFGVFQAAEHRILDGIADMPLLGHRIDQPERLCSPRVDGSAGQHQGHRLHRVDQRSEARGAAEAGMQAEHHFRKAKARIVDGDPCLTGERDLEAAAEAESVDHGDRRNLQPFETIDHRMRPADRGLDSLRIGRAAEFVDVGARDETGCLGGADHDSGRPLVLKRCQHGIEFFDDIGRQRIGAGVGAVEQQPGNAIAIARQLEIAIGSARIGLGPEFEHAVAENVHDLAVHDVPYTVSISIAPPCPPPIHSVAMPRRVPSRFMALTRCSTMRLPLQPTGWPRLIAPPSTFILVWSMTPAAPSRPRISLQNFSSFQAARQPSTCVANASFNSQVSISESVSSLRFNSSVADSTGPRPMMPGSSADHWLSRMTAFGVRPYFATASSDARITQDAPSVICEELPAVTWPQGRSNTGRNFASASGVESGRTPSS